MNPSNRYNRSFQANNYYNSIISSPTNKFNLLDCVSKETSTPQSKKISQKNRICKENKSSSEQKIFYQLNSNRFDLEKVEKIEEKKPLPSVGKVENKAIEQLTQKFIEETKPVSLEVQEKKVREKSFLKKSKEIAPEAADIKECIIAEPENLKKAVVADSLPLNFIKNNHIVNESLDKYRYDRLNYAENLFNPKNKIKAGQDHVSKRLELFGLVCKLLEEKKQELKEYRFFPQNKHQNEFAATRYIVPSKFSDSEIPPNSERAHISLFNKIIVEKNNELFRLDGKVLFHGQKVELRDLLNLCDITNNVVNEIDGIMEYHLRPEGKGLFDDILRSKVKAEEAAQSMKEVYNDELKILKKNILELKEQFAKTQTKAGMNFGDPEGIKTNDNFKKSMNKIVFSNTALEYIEGMLKATAS